MTEITADLVKILRERTGVGMMDCKKALQAAHGNLEQAIEALRKAGQDKAVKKGDRIATEGVIAIQTSHDNKQAVILEVNCETDFVAREAGFKQFAEKVAAVALAKQVKTTANLAMCELPGMQKSIEEQRLELVAQLGENITIRRLALLAAATANSTLGSYLHGGSGVAKIGAIVVVDSAKPELAKDLAMQVAAMKPEYIDESKVDPERLAKEKEIIVAQMQADKDSPAIKGKPAEIIEKIVAGKLSKFVRDITLVGQNSIKDPNKTIESILTADKTKVLAMVRFEVGEGIEKKSAGSFVDEVMSQVRSND